MSKFEILEGFVCDVFITPIFIFGLIITGLLWLVLLGPLYLFSQLTFLIHKAEKKRLKHEQEEFDAELDEAIVHIQMKSIKESERQDEF